jgi:hypothetical protein
MTMKKRKYRREAIAKLNDYIDFLIRDGRTPDEIASTEGTDAWLLSIDQYAMAAAKQERGEL